MSRSHGSSFRCLIYDAGLNKAANCNGNEDSTEEEGEEEDEGGEGGRVHSQSVEITSFIMTWWLPLCMYFYA